MKGITMRLLPGMLLLGLVSTGCSQADEAGSKMEYSILQALEYEHRGSTSEALIVERGGYRAIGVRPVDSRERVWVLLNPEYRPYVKTVPALPVRLSESKLDELLQQYDVHPEVARFLAGE